MLGKNLSFVDLSSGTLFLQQLLYHSARLRMISPSSRR